ncbi:hypothetical protein DL95DRAFT_382139 [Leptodontidium sp. 2 PMI_412]|nr:hypothetical protein DL95DRAFT_382139 [Leptodontidium sp. 2 PMI_412]
MAARRLVSCNMGATETLHYPHGGCPYSSDLCQMVHRKSHIDAQEPPILYPRISIIGYLLGVTQLQADYHTQYKHIMANIHTQNDLHQDLLTSSVLSDCSS